MDHSNWEFMSLNLIMEMDSTALLAVNASDVECRTRIRDGETTPGLVAMIAQHFGPPRAIPERGIASADGPERSLYMTVAGNIASYKINVGNQNRGREPTPPFQQPQQRHHF